MVTAAPKPPPPSGGPTTSAPPAGPPATLSDALVRNVCTYIVTGAPTLLFVLSPSPPPLNSLRLVRSVVVGGGLWGGTGRSFHTQVWYACTTCGLDNGKGCCASCAKGIVQSSPTRSSDHPIMRYACAVCHAGHQLVSKGSSGFYCAFPHPPPSLSSRSFRFVWRQRCLTSRPHLRNDRYSDCGDGACNVPCKATWAAPETSKVRARAEAPPHTSFAAIVMMTVAVVIYLWLAAAVAAPHRSGHQ